MKFRLIAGAFLAMVLLALYVYHEDGGEAVTSEVTEEQHQPVEVQTPTQEAEPGTEGNKKFNF